MNSTIALLNNHRSVRRYKDRPLPDGLLETLVAAGQRASTSSNLQAYSVIHVRDPRLKKEIAELCADQVQVHQSAAFLAFCADLHRDRLAFDMHGGDRFDGDFLEALLIATVDAALFMQNVAIAAESVGLGICMIGAIRNNPRAVGRLLGLPSYVYAVAGFCIGYPDQETAVKPRLPLQAVLHTDTYPDDPSQLPLMADYDRSMTEFYTSQGMHDRDPRWTRVMAGRVGRFHQRAELDDYLAEQGFGWKRSGPSGGE
jgi:nitroreductase